MCVSASRTQCQLQVRPLCVCEPKLVLAVGLSLGYGCPDLWSQQQILQELGSLTSSYGWGQCVSQNQLIVRGPGLSVMEDPMLAAGAEPQVTAQWTSEGAGAVSVCIFPKPDICVYVR